MPFVLDCSVTMAWVFPDEATEATASLRDSLLNESAVVPPLWPTEVGNVLLAATRRRRITQSVFDKSGPSRKSGKSRPILGKSEANSGPI